MFNFKEAVEVLEKFIAPQIEGFKVELSHTKDKVGKFENAVTEITKETYLIKERLAKLEGKYENATEHIMLKIEKDFLSGRNRHPVIISPESLELLPGEIPPNMS